MTKERIAQLEKKLWLLKESLESQVIDQDEYERSKARIEEEMRQLKKQALEEAAKADTPVSKPQPSAEEPQEKPQEKTSEQSPPGPGKNTGSSEKDSGQTHSTAAYESASSSFSKSETPKPEEKSQEEASEAASREQATEKTDEPKPAKKEETEKASSKVEKPVARDGKLSEKETGEEPASEPRSEPKPEPSPAPVPSEPSGDKPRWWLWILGVGVIIAILYASSVGLQGEDALSADDLYACMTDSDCAQPGMEAICVDPGTENASCVTQNATRLSVTVLTAEVCSACDTQRVRTILRGWFPGASITEVAMDSAEGESLREQHSISRLPAYFVEGPVEETLKYGQVQQVFDESGDTWVMRPGAAGSVYYPDRPESPGRIDVFLSASDASSVTSLRNMDEFIHAFPDAEVRYRFVSGENASTEACFSSSYPLAYPNYVACESADGGDCAGKAGIAEGVMSDCQSSDSGGAQVTRAQILQRDLGVTAVPSFFINNRMLVPGVQAADSLRENYCALNDAQGCGEELSASLV